MSNLPSGWVWANLSVLSACARGSIVDGPFGSKLKTSHYVSAGIRVIRLGNIGVGRFLNSDEAYISHQHAESLSRHQALPGDLLIAALAEPVGRCCEVPEIDDRYIVKADCVRFRPHPQVNPQFIMHWLNSPDGRRNSEVASHGIGRLRINKAEIEELRVPLPPFNEQRRIVARIEELTGRSRRAREALEAVPPLLDKLRQSVLAAAFSGRLTADWRANNPDVEPAHVLLERIKNERRQRWEETELAKMRAKGKETKNDNWKAKYKEPEPVDTTDLPELPNGWCWACLEELSLTIRNGISVKPSADRGIPILRISAVRPLRVNLDDHRFLPENVQTAGFAIRQSDLLFTRYNGNPELVGVCGVVPHLSATVVHPDKLIRVVLVDPFVSAGFIAAAVHTGQSRNHVKMYSKSAAGQVGIAGRDLKRMPIPLASLTEQREIASRIDEMLAGLNELSARASKLDNLLSQIENSVLERAFRGELVPQDPDDEPASVLLERIRAQREEEERTAASRSSRLRGSKSGSRTRNRKGAKDAKSTPYPSTIPDLKAAEPDLLQAVLDHLQTIGTPQSKDQILQALNQPAHHWPNLRQALATHPKIQTTGQKRGTRYGWKDIS
jgi:type I restriction enzyme S subunit